MQEKLPFPEAPKKLILGSEPVEFGNYSGPIADVNAEDFDFKRLKRPFAFLDKTARKYLKRWQFVGAMDENIVFGAAVAHVQYLGTGFSYVFDRRSGKILEMNLKKPLAMNTEFSVSPKSGTTSIKKGDKFISLFNTPEGIKRAVKVDLGKELQAEINYEEPGTGMTTTCPQDTTGFHYTYKTAGLPASGYVMINGEKYEFEKNALALMDWTASTPSRKTNWNWAAGVGHDDDGNPVGLNFSRGLVGGKYSQNAVWFNGVPNLMMEVNFGYDENDLLGTPWHLTTEDKALDITFTPENERYENINLGLVISNFHQPFGKFEGSVKIDGQLKEINMFGFCEEHFAKW